MEGIGSKKNVLARGLDKGVPAVIQVVQGKNETSAKEGSNIFTQTIQWDD